MKSTMIICNSLGTGGAEKQTVALANGLVRRGWKVILVCLSDVRDLYEQLDNPLKETTHFICRKKYIDFKAASKIRQLINHYSPQSILSVNQGPLISAILARGIRFDIPLNIGFHTTKLQKKDILKFFMSPWWLFKIASKVIYVCKTQMDYWSPRLLHMPGKGLFIYNGVDVNRYHVQAPEIGLACRKQLDIPDDALVLVSIAMLRPEKRHIDMLHVVKELKERSIDAFLVCVGDGPERQSMEALSLQLEIADRIVFAGLVSDVRPYLAAADASIMLSNSVETFSMAVLESLSCGCPVLAYDIGGIREQILSDLAGAVFAQGDSHSLIEKISQMAGNKIHSNKNELHKLVEKNFSEELMLEKYMQAL